MSSIVLNSYTDQSEVLNFTSLLFSFNGFTINLYHANGSDHTTACNSPYKASVTLTGEGQALTFALARHIFTGLAANASDNTINIDGHIIKLAPDENSEMSAENVVDKIVKVINDDNFNGGVYGIASYKAIKGEGIGMEMNECGSTEDGVTDNTFCLVLQTSIPGVGGNKIQVPADLSYTAQ